MYLKKYKRNIINSIVYSHLGKIEDNLIYIESMNGNGLSSDILHFLKELSKKQYNRFKINVYVKKEAVSHVEGLQSKYNLKIDKIISNDILATRMAEHAKYIVTDYKIRFRYFKRDGQVIINFCNENLRLYANFKNLAKEQTPFLLSDYLVVSNNYVYKIIFKSLLIENSFSGKILKEGSPRNVSFFKDDCDDKLNFEGKQIFVYMPCYWGKKSHDEFVKNIKKNLKELDKKLNSNQLVFFKVDGYAKKLFNLSKFKHIKEFPKDFDMYSVLNIAESFITDGSCILFDLISTHHKIILFNQHEDEYFKDISNHVSKLNLDCINVKTISELVNELNSTEESSSSFCEGFISYNHKDSVERICNHIFLQKDCCREETLKNDKFNVLIYVKAVLNNENYASLMELLSQADLDRYNFFITFRQWKNDYKKNRDKLLNSIPDEINILPLKSKISPTFIERIRYDRFRNSNKRCNNSIRNLFKREFKKQFNNMSFDYVLNFDGNHRNELLMFAYNDFKSSVWVHNDKLWQVENKIVSRNFLKEAYDNYDNIVVDASNLVSSTKEVYSKKDPRIVHNLINKNFIMKKLDEELKLDVETKVYTNNSNHVRGVLESSSKKILTINNRMYNEEWHENLLLAFDELCESYPDVQLIIIGELGRYYRLRWSVFNMKNWQNVTLIRNISNPTKILKECDLFIADPYFKPNAKYIHESECFDIPVIMCNDEVQVDIFEDFDGYVFNNSFEEILTALDEFMKGNIDTLKIDFDNLNKRYLDEFYELLE